MIKRIEIVAKSGIIYLGEPYQVNPKIENRTVEELQKVLSRHSITVSEVERWYERTVG